MAKTTKPLTKGQILTAIAEKTALKCKDVAAVFAELNTLLLSALKKNGVFVPPGLGMKVIVKKKPASKGGEKKINSLTGQEYVTKPKPAMNVVKIRPLKALKDAVK